MDFCKMYEFLKTGIIAMCCARGQVLCGRAEIFLTFVAMNKEMPPATMSVQWLFRGISAATLLCIFIGVLTEFYYLAAAPALLLLAYLTVVDFRSTFYLLLFCIPLSTEFYFPNGFGTDLPTEPMMLGLMGVFLLYVIRHHREIRGDFWCHPVTLLLLLHIGWIFITTITSSLFFISFKYFLAKIWYIVTFYFLSGMLLRKSKDVRQMLWVILLPLCATIVVILVKHAALGFTFESVYSVLHPFYRNHVMYAAIMAVFVPFVWIVMQWYKPWSLKWLFLLGTLLLLLIGIQFAYTRAAYVAIFIAIGAYYIIQFKLMKYVLAAGLVGAVALVGFLALDNRYLEFAPNYERTITHDNFGNLIEATYKLEDISTMERVYRWIAGAYMSKEEPVFGFGPGNFYNFYVPYTVRSFETYVSDNPEKSGVHSYYLMILVEQGYIGLAIFLILLFYVLLHGERIYHQTHHIRDKQIVMIAMQMLIIISALQLINDLLETDKIGPFFFMAMAMLVNVDLKNREGKEREQDLRKR